MSTVNLEAKRAALALARQQYEARRAELDAARAAFEADHAELIAEVDSLKEAETVADVDLRDEALKIYAADLDNKKPIEGVEVKLWDVMDFDRVEAETWARANMPALLVLDTAAYKKVLKEVKDSKILSDLIPLPGTVRLEPKVSIARDLSAYLSAVAKIAEVIS